MLQPATISVAITTPVNNPRAVDSWQLRSDEHLTATVHGGSASAALVAGRTVYDPYEDEAPASYRPPVDPRAWTASTSAANAPAVQAALRGLTSVVETMDWSAVAARPDHLTDAERAVVTLTFAERPTGVEHLRPIQRLDGSWSVRAQTSLDLLAQPALAPVLDAARAVIDAARAAS